MITNRVNFVASRIKPNPIFTDYWVDLSEDENGRIVKVKVGDNWVNVLNGGSGTGGTSNYNDLINKPKVNGLELVGNITIEGEQGPKGDPGPQGLPGKDGRDGVTPDTSLFATKQELNSKQDKLKSGVNIATINGQDITKGGDISIDGGGSGTSDYNALTNKPKIGGIVLSGDKTLNELNIQPKGDYAIKSEIPSIDVNKLYVDTALNKKVDKVDGKSLISDSEISRLSKVDNYTLTKSKIENILVGDITTHNHSTQMALALSVKADKSDILDMLTKTEANGQYANKSEIPDVSSFITKSVNDLVNYYKKNETYTQEEVNTRLGTITTINFKKVEVKPVKGESNIIYLVPSKTRDIDNIYEEWIYVDAKWELIGSTKADLTNYYDKKYVDETLAKKIELPKTLAQLTEDATHRLVTDSEKLKWNKEYFFDASTILDITKAPSDADVLEIPISTEDKKKIVDAIKANKFIYMVSPDIGLLFITNQVTPDNNFILSGFTSYSIYANILMPLSVYSQENRVIFNMSQFDINYMSAAIMFNLGSNEVTTLTNLPIDKRSIIANVTTNTTISLSSNLDIGKELYIKVINNSSSPIEQTIPNDSIFDSMSGTSITIPSKSSIEISIWCYDTNKYSIKVGGKL